ncbi:retinol dehydrogenase 13 isoform X2 [Eurytemora carolleeae]|uniref:retinol dehydrogenase 13 isoform X2 n=1 Tax=Eurytemora carolleeae TaxID=1294199 RepID=UPI000C75FAD6|nr:retinol dehydrogenase 13 isoform X2 [Eurytemora carolleeae]|eukprot:XP_023326832.1 retinol dehydrogenase 13-like isoform X2 [Eurytemora affinis]
MELATLIETIQAQFQSGLQLGVESVKGVLCAKTPTLPNTRLDGQVAVVTGANSGIGLETVWELSKRGAKVILGCRDQLKGEAVARELSKAGGKAVFLKLDLASFKSVEEFCSTIIKGEPSIDILVNNAGVFTTEKTLTEDGYELQFQVNHLSHFLLTNLLLDKIKAQDGGRIINVSSVAHWLSIGIPTDVNWEMVRYNGILAYSNTKLANVLFSTELAKRLKGSPVSVYSLHPGGVSTNLGKNIPQILPEQVTSALAAAFSWVAKTPEQGAQTSLYCCLTPNLPNGYYDNMRRGWN